MGDPNWHAHARMPLPPDHGAVKDWAEPGEVFYPGLRAIEWQQYLDTIWERGRRKRVHEATRTLFLTNRRLVVVDESRMLKTDLPLADVEDVSVGMPPSAPGDMPVDEAVVQVTFRAGTERRVVGWSTVRRDADLFAELLRELIRARRGESPPGGQRGSAAASPNWLHASDDLSGRGGVRADGPARGGSAVRRVPDPLVGR